jgi:hypothetical protein
MSDRDPDGGNASVNPNTGSPASISNQAVGRQMAALVEKLVYHTSAGNVHWVPKAGTTYVFEGTTARVEICSVDGDGHLPLRLEIFDHTGKRQYAWLVDFQSEEGDAWFDARIQALWEMVYVADDTLASLIEDLDALPPF